DILAGARLGLVRVQRQVVRLAVALRDERPLLAGGEAGPAATAQAGLLDLGDDLVRRRVQRLGQRLVAAGPAVGGEGEALWIIPVRGEHRGQGVRQVDASSAGAGPGSRPAFAAGAAQPRSLAIFRPSRSAGPAAGPSVAWPSGKPARIRHASRQV